MQHASVSIVIITYHVLEVTLKTNLASMRLCWCQSVTFPMLMPCRFSSVGEFTQGVAADDLVVALDQPLVQVEEDGSLRWTCTWLLQADAPVVSARVCVGTSLWFFVMLFAF